MANNKKTKPKEKSEIQKVHESALSVVQELKLTEETVLQYLNQKATKNEIALFLNQCKMFELNPFKREIYLIKYDQGSPATFVVGFEAFLKRAERAGKLTGWKAWTDGTIKTKDFKACLEIHRKDWDKPFYHEVFWDEYAQYKQDKKTLTRFWEEKPRTMLKKVVISQGFRMCFPDELGGMPYTAEEMPVDTSTLPKGEVIDVEVIPEEKPKEEPKAKKAKKTKEVEEEKEEEKMPNGPVENKEGEEQFWEDEEPEELAQESDPKSLTAQTRRFIDNAFNELEKDFGRDKTDLINKICDRIERLSEGKTIIEKFPDDLTEELGKKVLEWLDFTKKTHEEAQAREKEEEQK